MKDTRLKRVLAGTLALLNVAAFSTANVGAYSFTSIVANAEGDDNLDGTEEVTFRFYSDIATGITEIGVGTFNYKPSVITDKGLQVEVGTEIVVKSTTRLEFWSDEDTELDLEDDVLVNKDNITEKSTDAGYEYTVKVPSKGFYAVDRYSSLNVTDKDYEGETVESEDFDIKIDEKEVALEEVDGEDYSWASKDRILTGKKITVTSTKPFSVYAFSEADQDAAHEAVAVGKYDKTAGRYVLSGFRLEEDIVSIEIQKHVHSLAYTRIGKNLLIADCNAPEADVIMGEAAFLSGVYTGDVEVQTGGDAEDLEGDEGETTTEKGDVDLENGGKYTYDENGGVDVRLRRDLELLGYGGDAGATAEKLTAYEYQIKRDGKELESGIIKKNVDDDALEDSSSLAYPKYEVGDKYGDYVDFGKYKEIGHYEVTVTVWGQNNKDAAFTLTYSFDIVSQEITADDFDLYVVSVPRPIGESVSFDSAEIESTSDFAISGDTIELADAFISRKNLGSLAVDEKGKTVTDPYTIQLKKDHIYTDSSNNKFFGTPSSTSGEESETDTSKGYAETLAITARCKTDRYSNLEYGPEGYQIVNQQVGSELGVVNKIVVEIYDERYGGSKENPKTIEIGWQFAEEGADPYLYLAGKVSGLGVEVKGADAANAETIEAYIRKQVLKISVPQYDPEKVSFKYILESEYDTTLDLQQLDALTDGVPTEEGRYRVYLCYDGKLVEDYNEGDPNEGDYEFTFVSISKSDYELRFSKDAEITYSEDFELGDFTVYDFLNKESDVDVKEDTIKYSIYESDGTYWYDKDVKNVGLLDAGKYHVTVTADTADKKVAKGSFYLTVNKKVITEDMIGLIKRQYNDNKSVYVDNLLAYSKALRGLDDDLTEDQRKQAISALIADNVVVATDVFSYTDEDGKKQEMTNDICMTVVGGTSTAVRVGTYPVKLGISGALNMFFGVTAPLSTENFTNYTVSSKGLETEWSIVKENSEVRFREFDNGFARLFDGGKIHIALDRDEGKATAFGIIYDKNGKLAAPASENDKVAYNAATKALVVDGEFPKSGNGLTGAAMNKTTYGANIAPVDVETGVWVRPYKIDENGVVSYGEPKYFTLTEVTQSELKLRLADGVRVAGKNNVKISNAADAAFVEEDTIVDPEDTVKIKDDDAVSEYDNNYDYTDKKGNSYNVGPWEIVSDKKDDNGTVIGKAVRRVYYIATVKNALPAITNEPEAVNNRKEVKPVRFGFVYDKNGKIPAYDGTEESMNKAKELLIADNAKYCSTYASETNDFHGPNARGANISPSNTMTGLWVRTFVDFGDGLIVHTEPEYFESFNDYYKAMYGISFNPLASNIGDVNNGKAITVNDDDTKFSFYIKANAAIRRDYNGEYYGFGENGKGEERVNIDVNDDTNETVAVGVVVDKSGTITDPKKLIYGTTGLSSGKMTLKQLWDVTRTYPGTYGATLKKVDGTINVRPAFIVDDNLTIYGDIVSVTFEQAKAGILTWDVDDDGRV